MPRPNLTDRQAAVLRHAADGLTIEATATALGVTVAAATDVRHKLLTKLGAKSMPHAVLLACQAGILDGRPRRHGDHAGYAAHVYRGEDPCDACWKGERAYRAERRAARRAAKSGQREAA